MDLDEGTGDTEVIDEVATEVEGEMPKTEETPQEQEIEFVGFADEAPKPEDESNESTDPFKGKEAPEWVKQTRNENRELKKRLRELESKQQGTQTEEPKAPELGAKPTLESAGYDEEAYQAKLDDWYSQKQKVEAAKAAAEAKQKAESDRWNVKVQGYNAAKAALARNDFEDVEQTVQEALTPTQIGVLLEVVKDPAALVYALGKSPSKLAALKELNPLQTAAALAKLEATVQVNRKPKVAGETIVQGAGRAVLGSTAKLAQLEAEADRTGDRSKVHAYQRQMRQQANSRS